MAEVLSQSEKQKALWRPGARNTLFDWSRKVKSIPEAMGYPTAASIIIVASCAS